MLNASEVTNIANQAQDIIYTALSEVPAENWSLRCKLENITIHFEGYAEPGYDAQHLVATGDWNDHAVGEALEQLGIEIEWDDEWTTCGGCGRLVRTSGDSWGWKPSYTVVDDCELYCTDCTHPEEYLLSICNNPKLACTLDIDPSQHGFTEYPSKSHDGHYIYGWHGNDESPEAIFERAKAEGHARVLFKIEENQQFQTYVSCWVSGPHED